MWCGANLRDRRQAIRASPARRSSSTVRQTPSSYCSRIVSIRTGTGRRTISPVRRWATGSPRHWAERWIFHLCNLYLHIYPSREDTREQCTGSSSSHNKTKGVNCLVARNGRVGRVHTRVPAVLGGRVVRRRATLSGSLEQVLAIGALGRGVVVPEETATAQLGNQQLDDVDECAGLDRVCLVGLAVVLYRMYTKENVPS